MLYEPLCCLSINQRRIKALASRFDDRSIISSSSESAKSDSRLCEWNHEFARIILRRTLWQQVPHSPRPADTCLQQRSGNKIGRLLPSCGNKKRESIDVRDFVARDSVWLPYVIIGCSSLDRGSDGLAFIPTPVI